MKGYEIINKKTDLIETYLEILIQIFKNVDHYS